MDDLDIIILAAGKGTRMGGDKAKVLTDVKGRPMLSYVLDTVSSVHKHKPVIVIGYQGDVVKQHFGESYRYVEQKEQKGTGHAASVALHAIRPEAKHVLVLYGDQPLINPNTVKSIYESHISQKANTAGDISPVTLATVTVPDFEDWRKPFYDFGRIVRDSESAIVRIVEKKDATEAERALTEVNPSYFCFDAEWLRKNINKIDTKNVQGEYYLTDIVAIAQKEGYKLNSQSIPPQEALGVNTPEQLEAVLKFFL